MRFWSTRSGLAVTAGLALLAGTVPFAFSSYGLDQVTLVLIYAIAILGLNMVSGYAGAISLGHGAFFAIGAYTEAILVHRYAVDPFVAIACASIVAWLSGLAFGFPALRLRGLYLALGTLAIAMSVPPLLRRFESFTGGHSGIVVETLTAPKWSHLSTSQWTYFVVLVIAALLFAIAWRLLGGALGRALLATRDHEIVAQVMGVNPTRYLTLTFALSSLYAGTAGALYTLAIGFVSPDSFTLMLGLGFFVGGVVGGLTSVGGAIFGGLFLQYVPVWASDIDKALGGFVYGAILIASMLLMPEGLAGVARRFAAGWPRRREERAATVPRPGTVEDASVSGHGTA
jgi:branched-chain amino acid transport system permease protein